MSNTGLACNKLKGEHNCWPTRSVKIHGLTFESRIGKTRKINHKTKNLLTRANKVEGEETGLSGAKLARPPTRP